MQLERESPLIRIQMSHSSRHPNALPVVHGPGLAVPARDSPEFPGRHGLVSMIPEAKLGAAQQSEQHLHITRLPSLLIIMIRSG